VSSVSPVALRYCTNSWMNLVDARHKPEGMADSGKAGGGGGKTQNLSSAHGMSIEEAQLILNVKKGDSMERILEVSRPVYPPAV
jgi:hypothetical protein